MGLRRRSREAALQVLYQLEFHRGPDRERSISDFWERFNAAEDIRQYAFVLLRGVLDHQREIDQAITRSANRWRMSRMSLVDRNILRLAIFEMYFQQDVPQKVAINEALEISKNFSQPSAASFINGVLDRIMRDGIASPDAAGPAEDPAKGRRSS